MPSPSIVRSASRHKPSRLQSVLSRTSSTWSFKSVRSTFSSRSSWSRKSKTFEEIEVTVGQIRPHILQAIQDQPHLYHPKDVNRIRITDEFIQRFITEHQAKKKNNWEEIVGIIVESLKWRKEFGLNDLNHRMFPKEFYDLKVFVMGQIGPKEFMLYTKARRFRKFDGLQDRILQFLVYCLESKAEEYGDDVKLTCFADVSNCGVSQLDVKLFMSAIPIFLKNYPAIAQHAYIYELPWLLKPFAKFILSCLPAKYGSMVTFVSKSDYLDIVPNEKLADYLGGPVKTIDFEPAEDAITLEELGKELGLSPDVVKKGRKIVQEVMKEVEKEESRGNKA